MSEEKPKKEEKKATKTEEAPENTPKLSKKERKAQEFKLKKKRSLDPELESETQPVKETKIVKKEAPKKPKNPPRFILFVGNLPYDVTEEKLREHFKTANPQTIRMRKGFAFVEFEGDEASKNLNHALRFHHTSLGYRKINVELTAGGGGNSQNRRKKVEQKNTALQEELAERAEQERKAKIDAKKANEAKEKKAEKDAKKIRAKAKKAGPSAADKQSIHPDRLRNLD